MILRISLILISFSVLVHGDVKPPPAQQHSFEYHPGPATKPSSVNVAGTFNGWSTNATPMVDRGDGTYVATISLPNGIYQYKFVIDGKEWKADPAHSDKELEESDGSGGKNSAFFVGRDARKAPPAKPNAINADYLIHDPGSSD